MKLTSKSRNKLPAKDFALPAERKYPVDTKNRSINAKARASEMANKGKISKSTENKIDKKADKVLKENDRVSVSVRKISNGHIATHTKLSDKGYDVHEVFHKEPPVIDVKAVKKADLSKKHK